MPECGEMKQRQIKRWPRNHNLKTWPEFYDAVESGIKTFEERLNDRFYEVGDTLTLQKYDPNKQEYTGDELVKRVPYILREPYAKEGHVIMSLAEANRCENCRWNYEACIDLMICHECKRGSNWRALRDDSNNHT